MSWSGAPVDGSVTHRPTAMIQWTLPSGQTTRYSAEYARALSDGALPALPRALAVVGVDRLEPAGPGRQGLVGRKPEQRLGPGVHGIVAGREIVLPGAEAGGLQRQLERLLLPAKLLLRLLALRQVAQPPGEPEQATLAIVHAGGGDRSPEAAAVLPEQPAVGGELPPPGRLGQVRGRRTALAVVGGVEVGGGGLEELGLLVAQHPADAGVPAGRSSLGVEQDDRVVLDLVERRPEALLAGGRARSRRCRRLASSGSSSSGRGLGGPGARARCARDRPPPGDERQTMASATSRIRTVVVGPMAAGRRRKGAANNTVPVTE